MTRIARLTTLALCALFVSAAAAFAAASPQDVISDWQAHNGAITGTYCHSTLRAALSKLPTDEREYSNFQTAVSQALTKAQPSGCTSSNHTWIWLVVVIVVLAGAITGAIITFVRRAGNKGAPRAS